jgi:hypothetical protein
MKYLPILFLLFVQCTGGDHDAGIDASIDTSVPADASVIQ